MATAATVDLHWEVKKKALDFWEEVISERLKNQGVIDGAFPEVTFSKEHKKIITLKEAEIHKRLNKVLAELSENGCLGVLMSAMRDDIDTEVVRRAVEVSRKFREFLEDYNLVRCEEINRAVVDGICVQRIEPKEFLKFIYQDLDKLADSKRLQMKHSENFEAVLDEVVKNMKITI